VRDRALKAAEELPTDVVYVGISLGVMPAQQLTQTRPGARGAVFLEACVPVSEFGQWPDGVPVQIHGMDADPFFALEGDIDAARALVEAVDNAALFVYPGDRHLFTDPSLGTYDPEAAALAWQRVQDFLARLDR
jgi:dienelactone hydrolase